MLLHRRASVCCDFSIRRRRRRFKINCCTFRLFVCLLFFLYFFVIVRKFVNNFFFIVFYCWHTQVYFEATNITCHAADNSNFWSYIAEYYGLICVLFCECRRLVKRFVIGSHYIVSRGELKTALKGQK